MTVTKPQNMRLPPDVIAYVHEHQRPRESFGAALRRLLGLA